MSIRLAPGCYYGDEVTERALGELRLSERLYGPNEYLERHTHERAYVSFALQGGYTETCGSRAYECAPLGPILHPVGEAHADRFHVSGARVFNIEIAPGWMSHSDVLRRILSRRIVSRDAALPGLIRRIYAEFRGADSVSPLAVEGLSLELLAEMARQPSTVLDRCPPRWLKQVRDLLEARYLDDWTLAKLAAEAHVHPTHLARAFRRHYRCTVGDFVRMRRLEFARAHLADPDASLGAVALMAGFSDQSHFTRLFKRRFGVTPGQYRASAETR